MQVQKHITANQLQLHYTHTSAKEQAGKNKTESVQAEPCFNLRPPLPFHNTLVIYILQIQTTSRDEKEMKHKYEIAQILVEITEPFAYIH